MEDNLLTENAELIKSRMRKLEDELASMEKKFDKKIKAHKRKFSHKYVKTVSSVTYLKGKLSVLEELNKVEVKSSPKDLNYIG